jgi:hypothetical protein
MIIHLVFFKMLPEAEGASGPENADKLVERLQALPGLIPEIQELSAGTDFSGTPASYDVGLLTKFASKEDLETYRVHPDHQKVVAFVQATTSDRAVVDYEA